MLHFNKYVQDGEQFIREIAEETNTPWDMIHAFRILRAVLHTLRNRLTPVTSLQLIAQFPMLIKAVYVDGWKISDEIKTLRHLGDFIEAVREEGAAGLVHDFVTDLEVQKAIRAVFTVIKRHVSEGEINDVLATLPAELRPLLENKQDVGL
jgi:uncharacterized protein (DUF2267 family)